MPHSQCLQARGAGMENTDSNAPRLSVIGIVISAYLAVDYVIPSALDSNNEFVMMVLMGICVAQINLIATWSALAPGNIVVRLPWSMLLGVLMWYAIVLGFRAEDRHFSLSDATVLGIVLLCGLAVLQIPLWIAARVFRWRLVAWDAPAREAGQVHSQFYLRHIMLGMVFLSLALAPARVVLPEGEIRNLGMDGELFVLLGAVVICNIVVTIPCIWGAFLPWMVVAPMAVGWLVYCAILTGMEFAVLCAILGSPGGDDVPFLIYLLNITQCATVFGTLLVLRGLGFQLVRVSSSVRPSQDQGSASGKADDRWRTGVFADADK